MSPHELHLHWKNKQMTDKQINAAIETVLHQNEHWMISRDYCTDLNAIHEAEQTLKGMALYEHIDQLFDLCYEPTIATARQRAEAFLRTLGKWEEVQG